MTGSGRECLVFSVYPTFIILRTSSFLPTSIAVTSLVTSDDNKPIPMPMRR